MPKSTTRLQRYYITLPACQGFNPVPKHFCETADLAEQTPIHCPGKFAKGGLPRFQPCKLCPSKPAKLHTDLLLHLLCFPSVYFWICLRGLSFSQLRDQRYRVWCTVCSSTRRLGPSTRRLRRATRARRGLRAIRMAVPCRPGTSGVGRAGLLVSLRCVRLVGYAAKPHPQSESVRRPNVSLSSHCSSPSPSAGCCKVHGRSRRAQLG